jgi:phosphatidylserine/phosphatidylglycerophosphate/cardiolipin synthase-like enzyme
MPTKPSLKAYRGDAKTLLAFNLPKSATKGLAGFTIQCAPDGQAPYYLQNTLRFETPGDHAQDAAEPATSSINAPFHKFRWLHVPGSVHQGTDPFFGPYTYTVTPRTFDAQGSLQPLDPAFSASVQIDVGPFETKGLKLGFTRGFTQSQAFVHHFGLKAAIRPKAAQLVFDTAAVSGKNAGGQTFTFADEYKWLGFTARSRIFDILAEVQADRGLHLDVFAYDLNEPDVISALLALAKQGRVRVVLDNASLHKSSAKKKAPEDEFEQEFNRVAKKPAAILRGHFGRYAHDKVFIVSNSTGPRKVLTGSTNFSVTGLYVNSNHVLVFEDPKVAAEYQQVFDAVWQADAAEKAFVSSPLSQKVFSFSSRQTPATDVTFSPHAEDFAEQVLEDLVARVQKEGKKKNGSVLFAVMELKQGTGPVYPALQNLHKEQSIFSFGISDTPDGISLYAPGRKSGVLVTGKPVRTRLPAPFDQVPTVGGVGHQIHHKFVVCGFNGDDPVVYCGSSNLALGGEQSNGDNLLAIRDGDVATAFAIEALALVDHFDFLDRFASATGKGKGQRTRVIKAAANKSQAAASAGWFLSTDDRWAQPYYDKGDLHFVDRELFG